MIFILIAFVLILCCVIIVRRTVSRVQDIGVVQNISIQYAYELDVKNIPIQHNYDYDPEIQKYGR